MDDLAVGALAWIAADWPTGDAADWPYVEARVVDSLDAGATLVVAPAENPSQRRRLARSEVWPGMPAEGPACEILHVLLFAHTA